VSGAAARLPAIALLLAAAPASGQLYDPAFRWRTLETAHFRLHFHQGEEVLAQEVAREAERAHAVLAPLLGHAPRGRTEIVLSDDTDSANGSATPIPYNTIRLFAVPPGSLSELNAFRDWRSSLIFHEYVHVLHLDNVGGLPAVGNRVFGKLFTPNGLVPAWMIEGVAVQHEADGDPGPGVGRNRSALHEMYARALATEPPGFPRLDQISNPPLDWPAGDVPYLLGGRFLAFLDERAGPEKVAGYLADQGSQIWPYAPSWAGARWFGEGFPALWAAYARAEEARFADQLARIRERPVTRPARLTYEGGRAGWPRWAPDGSFIAYHRQGLDRRPALHRVSPDGRDLGRARAVESNGALALLSGREAIVAVGEVWREHRVYDDLWRIDLETGARRRITDGARATDPAVSPDGRSVAFVRRTGGGEMALVRRPLEGGHEETLLARPGAQLYSPTVSPAGTWIALELHEQGRRDVVLLERDRLVRVTDDVALDTGPSFTPDGRWLLFSSDRGGVYNLYAWPVAACLGDGGGEPCALRQVTNVETGAFQPAVSPDGRTIALVTYSRAGYDLATIPFDPATWLDPPHVEAAPAAPAPAPPAPSLPARPYRAWRTLAPTFWFPVWGSDGAGPILGAVTGGRDVLARHAYALQAWWSLDAREAGYLAGYAGGWSWPRLDLSSSRIIDDAPGGQRLEAIWTPLDAGLSFTFTRLGSALELRLGWAGTWYDLLGDGRTAPSSDLIGVAGDGFLSELTFRAAYSDARRFVRSISAEEGRTVTLQARIAAPELGSGFSVARVRAAIEQYARVPWTRHAALALRLSGGIADGSIGGRAPFELGGVAPPDLVSLALFGPASGADELRGYPSDWLAGSGFALANLELRLPLASPRRGYSTWPAFLRRVHGALFADLGDAFDLPGELPFAGHHFDARELRLGAGGELRLELVLGYNLVANVRLGLAHAFGRVFQGESRERGTDAISGYVTIGQAF
jgi:Tol biopolymer transport system component